MLDCLEFTAILVCPTYYLLEAFGSKAWKVTGFSLLQLQSVSSRTNFRENLLFHQVIMVKMKGTTLQRRLSPKRSYYHDRADVATGTPM